MEEALLQGMYEHGEDWTRLHVIADWYEEQGRDHEAAFMRWKAQERKRPHREVHLTNGEFEARWYWFRLGDFAGMEDGDPSSDLPLDVYGWLYRIGLARGCFDHQTCEYFTIEEAETALRVAWMHSKGW